MNLFLVTALSMPTVRCMHLRYCGWISFVSSLTLFKLFLENLLEALASCICGFQCFHQRFNVLN